MSKEPVLHFPLSLAKNIAKADFQFSFRLFFQLKIYEEFGASFSSNLMFARQIIFMTSPARHCFGYNVVGVGGCDTEPFLSDAQATDDELR